jgi:hypothetical protein
VRAALQAIFGERGIAPLYEDPLLTVYRVPEQEQNGPLVGLGDGWYEREGEAGRYWRWTTGRAQVLLTNPHTATMRVSLEMDTYSLLAPRTLIALLDSREIARATVNPHPSQRITVELDLSPGEHWVELRSAEPPDEPEGDARKLSLGFERVAIVEK